MGKLSPNTSSKESGRLAKAQPPLANSRQLINANLPQQAKIAQHLARAEHDRCQRIIRDGYRQPCFLADPLVQVLEQRAAARQHDAAIADVRGKLRWSALERRAHRIHDRRHALVQGLADFAVIDGNRARHTLDQVAPLHFYGDRFFQRIGGTDLHFDLFRGTLAHQWVVFALQILHHGFIHLVSGYAHGARVNDAAHGNHRDVRGAAADVDHHVSHFGQAIWPFSYSEIVRIFENSLLQARQRKLYWGTTTCPPKSVMEENPSRTRTWRQSAAV